MNVRYILSTTLLFLAAASTCVSSTFTRSGMNDSFPIYNLFPWVTPVSGMKGLVLINITADRNVFDYCDLYQYKYKSIIYTLSFLSLFL